MIQDISVEMSFFYEENRLDGREKKADLFLKGVLRLFPLNEENEERYRAEWKRAEIFSGKALLVGFEESEEQIRYWSSTGESEQKRKRAFSALQIDLSDHDANNDMSLLQRPFYFTLLPNGQIVGLQLPRKVKRQLYALLAQTLMGAEVLKLPLPWKWKWDRENSKLSCSLEKTESHELMGRSAAYHALFSGSFGLNSASSFARRAESS